LQAPTDLALDTREALGVHCAGGSTLFFFGLKFGKLVVKIGKLVNSVG
jgi:hypothetical protein